MIYQSHLKKLTEEKNRILNSQLLKNVILVKEMAQNLVTLQIGVHTVVETVKLDLIKVSLQFNKHARNVMVMVKKSLIRAMTAMAKGKNKLLRKYQ